MNALITNMINNVFHMIWFCSIVAEPRHSRKKTVLIVAVTTMLVEMISLAALYVRRTNILPYETVTKTVSYFTGFLTIMTIYTLMYVLLISASHPAKSLFMVAAYFSLWAVIYCLVSIITDTYAGAGNVVIWVLRIGLNLLFLIPYLLFFRNPLFRMYKEIKSGYWLISTLSIMCFAMQSIFLIYNDRARNHDMFFILLLFSSFGFMVAVYAMIFRYMSQSGYAYRMERLESNEKFLLAQIDSYEKMAENARQTRHDFRHHNMVVMEYAKNKNYEGIITYLQEYEEKETEKYIGTFCANHAVDTVLSAYTSRCGHNGIEVDTDIRMDEPTWCSDYDLVTILANILENAVNGCMKTTGARRIDISVRQKENKIILVCKNTCVPNIPFENGLPKNRKHDGIGVESILNTIAKYNGDADFSAADGIFVCRVILNNKKSERQ